MLKGTIVLLAGPPGDYKKAFIELLRDELPDWVYETSDSGPHRIEVEWDRGRKILVNLTNPDEVRCKAPWWPKAISFFIQPPATGEQIEPEVEFTHIIAGANLKETLKNFLDLLKEELALSPT